MKGKVLLLSTVASLGVISGSLCAPALPFIADRFSAGFSSVQFTISLFLIGNAFGQLCSGPLSDRAGQKKTLLGALFIFIFASLTCACAESFGALLLGRFFQGMGSAAGPVLSRAMAASFFPPTRSAQVQSYGAMGVGAASILAILCSGYLTLSSWRYNFWLAAGFGAFLFIWTLLSSLPGKNMSARPVFSQLGKVLGHPVFLRNALCHAATYGLMYGYIGLFPFLLRGKSSAEIGVYSAIMILAYMLGSFFAARFSPLRGVLRLVVWGVGLQLVSGVFLLLQLPFFPLLASLALFNMGIGMILPLTAAGALAPFSGQATGSASSCLGLTYRMLGSFLSTGLGYLPIAMGGSLGGAMVLLSIVSLFLVKNLISFKGVEQTS